MLLKKTILSTAIVGALGLAASAVTTTASAAINSLVDDGMYELRITTTATRVDPYGPGGTNFKITPPSGLESSFTFGAAPNAASQGMTDNNNAVVVANDWSVYYGPDAAPGSKGTGIIDTYAGLITFDVVEGSIQQASTFSVDTIAGTAGGNFAQFISGNDLSNFTGSIDLSGNMTFTPTGRMGAIDGPAGGVIGRWNVDSSAGNPAPFTSAWNSFTTGSADGGAGVINGTACSGTAGNYSCTLVSAGGVGADWGTFFGNPYYEVWKIDLVRIGNAASASPVPVPAAVWLFGSGLIGLVGVARRRKTS